MTIIKAIQDARNLGANDEQILKEILKANPQKAKDLLEAKSRGANAQQIVGAIMSDTGNRINHLRARGLSDERIFNVLKEEGEGKLSVTQAIGRGFEDRDPNTLTNRSKILSAGKGFLKDTTETASGIGNILGLVSDEDQELNKRVLTPISGAEKTGDFLSSVAQFLVPAGGIARTGQAANRIIRGSGIGQKIAGTGNLGSKAVATTGLAGAGAVEGAAFGGIEALRKGGIDEDVKTTAAVSVAFPLLGGVLKATGVSNTGQFFKNLASRFSLGKAGKEIVEENKDNKFIFDVINNKIGSVSIADDIQKTFQKRSQEGFEALQKTREALSNRAVIPTNKITSTAFDSVRSVLNLKPGSSITRDTLVKRALSSQEANKVLSVLEDIGTKAGEPVKKISPKRLDEIIRKLDQIKAHEKTDDGSKVINAIRGEVNKLLPKDFINAKQVASKEIRQLENDIKAVLGIPKDKVLRDELNNPDQIGDKVRTLIKKADLGDVKVKTLEAIKAIDDRIGTNFHDQIKAVNAVNRLEKALNTEKELLAINKQKGTITTGSAITAGSTGALLTAMSTNNGVGLEEAVGALGVVGLIAAFKSPRVQKQAIQWVLNTPAEVKQGIFERNPAFADVIKSISLVSIDEE
jgi:hypothetical protein